MAHRVIRSLAEFEEWHAIPGYEGRYEITKSGRVRSLPRYVNSPICAGGRRRIKGKEFTIQLARGYPCFLGVDESGRKTTVYIHRILAMLFVPNPAGKPHVNHIDGDKTNFDPANLEWVTHKENIRHAIATGLMTYTPTSGPGDKSPAAKLDWDMVGQIRALLANGATQSSVAKQYGVAKGTIGYIARNETWRVPQ
jgi:hypothetical protein